MFPISKSKSARDSKSILHPRDESGSKSQISTHNTRGLKLFDTALVLICHTVSVSPLSPTSSGKGTGSVSIHTITF